MFDFIVKVKELPIMYVLQFFMLFIYFVSDESVFFFVNIYFFSSRIRAQFSISGLFDNYSAILHNSPVAGDGHCQ